VLPPDARLIFTAQGILFTALQGELAWAGHDIYIVIGRVCAGLLDPNFIKFYGAVLLRVLASLHE